MKEKILSRYIKLLMASLISMEMKLYLIHCGFYDSSLSDGIYEGHTNFFVAASSFETAKLRAKEIPDFKARKMHIDGLQEIRSVDGYDIHLSANPATEGKTILLSNRHRDLAPIKPTN